MAHAIRALEATVHQIEGTERERGTRRISPRLQSGTNAARGRLSARRDGRRNSALLRWLLLLRTRANVKTGAGRQQGCGDGLGSAFKEAGERGNAPTSRSGALRQLLLGTGAGAGRSEVEDGADAWGRAVSD